MRTLEQFLERLRPYRGVSYVYRPCIGYVAWRVATGENLEILFIRAAESGKGHGGRVLREMVTQITLAGPEPYHSVFAYRLASNADAERFYCRLGFHEIALGQSIYRDDGTVLVWIPWSELIERLKKC